MCEEAQSWANHLAHTDTFAYQNKINHGQNIFCRKPTDPTAEIDGKVNWAFIRLSSRIFVLQVVKRRSFLIESVLIVSGKAVVREWYSSSKVFKPRKNPKMYSANINSGNRRTLPKCGMRKRKKLYFFFIYITGPFTQLIWSNTKELGVGKACSRSGRIFVVANYNPRGNVNGQYVNNVHMNQYFLPVNKKKLEIVTRH